MPKNNTNKPQFALVYNQNYLHVVIVDPELVIDSGLETLEIYDNLGDIITAILGLDTNRKNEANNKLNKATQDRGIE
jgi:hypothetical protein